AGEFDAGLTISSQDFEAAPEQADENTLDFGLDDASFGESSETVETSTDDDFSFDLDLEDAPHPPHAADDAFFREVDIGSSTTRYGLSFDESPEAAEEDEFALDLEDDFLSDSDEVKAAPEISSASFEDDLGELSFELEDEPSA